MDSIAFAGSPKELTLVEQEAQRVENAGKTWTFGEACRALLDFMPEARLEGPTSLYHQYVLESLLTILDGSTTRAIEAGIPEEAFAGILTARTSLGDQLYERWDPDSIRERFELLSLEILAATHTGPS